MGEQFLVHAGGGAVLGACGRGDLGACEWGRIS